jgi:hypothetical protein
VDGIQGDLQQQQAKSQQPQERPACQPPEIDERWFSLVERDTSTGVYVSKPG